MTKEKKAYVPENERREIQDYSSNWLYSEPELYAGRDRISGQFIHWFVFCEYFPTILASFPK